MKYEVMEVDGMVVTLMTYANGAKIIGNVDGIPLYIVRLLGMMQVWAERQNPPASMDDAFEYLKKILPLIQPRIKLLSEIPDHVDFFFLDFPVSK